MKYKNVEGISVGCDIPDEEMTEYIKRGIQKHGNKLYKVRVKICNDDENDVDIEYVYHGTSFNRLRRITGYLVGSLDRWNDGKRSEEHDRVKHGV